MPRLRVVVSGDLAPALNMGIDEALLVLGGTPTLRLYGWSPPGLSLGYFQASAPFRALPGPHLLVRRLTGGGAIYHDREITFALTLDQALLPRGVPESYALLHEALAQALTAVGVPLTTRAGTGFAGNPRPREPWCLADPGPHDLMTKGGRKLVGSAQRRIARPRPRVLHHGSIVLHAPAATPGIGAVGEHADAAALAAPLRERVAAEIAVALGLDAEPGALTEAELQAAEDLAARRYRDPRFTLRR